jgi:hypothetical protein
VNALYEQIPEADRPDITGERWSDLEMELDMRCAAGDGLGALHAIEIWEVHTRGVLQTAAGPLACSRSGPDR